MNKIAVNSLRTPFARPAAKAERNALLESLPLWVSRRQSKVFDGHGDQGKKMSHFAKQAPKRSLRLQMYLVEALSKSLFSNTDLHTEPVAAIQAKLKN